MITEEGAGMANEKYNCDFCGAEIGWEENDDVHGDIWSCENCGKVFCSKCLREAIGEEEYWKMMLGGDFILCPDCYTKGETHNEAL